MSARDGYNLVASTDNSGRSGMIRSSSSNETPFGTAEDITQLQQGAGVCEPEYLRKLFIGLGTGVTTYESLKRYYSQWGEITGVVVIQDRQAVLPSCFAFITYAKAASVDAAMSSRPHMVGGMLLDPKRAMPYQDVGREEYQISVKKLFVRGIQENHTAENLREYFSNFGTVEKVDMLDTGRAGEERGFGFVTFDDYDSVDKLVLLGSGEIAGRRCEFSKSLSDVLGMQKTQLCERYPHWGLPGMNPASGNSQNTASANGGRRATDESLMVRRLHPKWHLACASAAWIFLFCTLALLLTWIVFIFMKKETNITLGVFAIFVCCVAATLALCCFAYQRNPFPWQTDSELSSPNSSDTPRNPEA